MRWQEVLFMIFLIALKMVLFLENLDLTGLLKFTHLIVRAEHYIFYVHIELEEVVLCHEIICDHYYFFLSMFEDE
jgi:hypothetical protein